MKSSQQRAPRRDRVPLTRQRVTEVAFQLIEQHGAEQFSIRTLGAALDVEGMAVYRHVRDKNDLLDAVAARLLDELDLTAARSPRLGWQHVVRRVVAAWVRLAEDHPLTFPLLYRDREPVAADLEPAELIIGALLRSGFTPVQAGRAYRTIVSFVDGVLLARSISGYDPQTDLWHRVPANLTEQLPAVHAARATLRRSTAEDVISHGLQALMTGIDQLRTRRQPTTAPRREGS